MAKKKKRGGAREGAGRPEAEDKAMQVTFYVKQSRVDALGKAGTRSIAINAVEKEYKKRKSKK